MLNNAAPSSAIVECPGCGYDISAHDVGDAAQVRCPECGSMVSPMAPIQSVAGWRGREMWMMCRMPLRVGLGSVLLTAVGLIAAGLHGVPWARWAVSTALTSILLLAASLLFLGATLPVLWRTRVAQDPRWRRIGGQANALMLAGLGVNLGVLLVVTGLIVVIVKFL